MIPIAIIAMSGAARTSPIRAPIRSTVSFTSNAQEMAGVVRKTSIGRAPKTSKSGRAIDVRTKSATSHDVEPGKIISGVPAFDNRDWLRSVAAYRRLGEMAKTIRELERKLEKMIER